MDETTVDNGCRRRDFLKGLGAAAVTAAVAKQAFAADPPTGKPNVILMIADDLSWCDAGCYGGQDAKTPNIDKLATQGMRFTRAFTATAMCAPTRQQLYTGVFPVRNGAFPNHSKVKPGTRSIVHHLKALGYRVGLYGKKHFGPTDSFPFEAGDEAFITRDKKQPYCLIVASKSPHAPWPKPDGYDPAKLTMPVFLPDNPETRYAYACYLTDVTAGFDAQVGQWVKAVDESGTADNTMVIATSEQGSNFPGAKWTCYDLGLRTQFIVRWPGKVKAGAVSGAMIQYVDVVPTLIEAAGGDPAKIDTGRPGAAGGGSGFDGRSFLGVLLGKTDKHSEYVYGVHTTQGIISGKPYPIRSIRDRRYRYIRNLKSEVPFQNIVTEQDREKYWQSWLRDSATDKRAAMLAERYCKRPAEEFYDTQADPFEMTNLAANPAHRAKMDAMSNLLDAWMAQQGDEGIKTELSYVREKKGKRK